MAIKSFLTIQFEEPIKATVTFKPDREKCLKRLETIEQQLEPLYHQYEGVARGSKEHTQVWTKISNLEHERDMLEAMLS